MTNDVTRKYLRKQWSRIPPLAPRSAWRQVKRIFTRVMAYERNSIERRCRRERRNCRRLLRREKMGDHVVFAVVLIFIFLGVNVYLSVEWAKMPLDATFAALCERLLFGRG